METDLLRFSVQNKIDINDVQRIERALVMVDPDVQVSVDATTQTVFVESWLMPEEFFVAFLDEDIKVKIV